VLGELEAPSAPVAERMGLVDDDEIESGAELGEALKATPDPEPLEAAHVPDAIGYAIFLQSLEVVRQHRVVGFDQLVAEAVLHLVLPLLHEGRRADHEHPVGLLPGVELGPHEACLDGLAEADLVGDEQASAARPRGDGSRA
jgi:hypothetical protein